MVWWQLLKVSCSGIATPNLNWWHRCSITRTSIRDFQQWQTGYRAKSKIVRLVAFCRFHRALHRFLRHPRCTIRRRVQYVMRIRPILNASLPVLSTVSDSYILGPNLCRCSDEYHLGSFKSRMNRYYRCSIIDHMVGDVKWNNCQTPLNNINRPSSNRTGTKVSVLFLDLQIFLSIYLYLKVPLHALGTSSSSNSNPLLGISLSKSTAQIVQWTGGFWVTTTAKTLITTVQETAANIIIEAAVGNTKTSWSDHPTRIT